MNRETSVLGGLAVAGVVYSVHSNFTPTQADIQGLPSGNHDIDGAERKATWLSIGIVSGVSLLAKDPTIFVIGSAMTVAMAFFTRHAVWTDSMSGLVNAGPGQSAVSANDVATGPQMSDTEAYTMYAHNDFVSS
jgi:hypothetical protein